MKKKGLLISTIVMVVVLIASLTTATYAWFSADAKTSIQGFNVNVVSNNVVNIGLKGSTYNTGTSADEFVSGDCTYTRGNGNTAEGYVFGTWTGNASLAPQITTTDVNWGTQSTAVGFIATANQLASSANGTNTQFVPENANNVFTPIAANGTGASTISGTPSLAYENYTDYNGNVGGTEVPGSFAYLFLGVQATKKLQDNTNKFTIVLVPQGNGTTLGISAAIHVAYRVKLGSGAWSSWDDVDVYGNNSYSTARASVAAGTLKGNFAADLGLNESAYAQATNTTTTSTGCGILNIDLSNYSDPTVPAVIDQIELIIYLAGHDSDCINSAINGMQTNVYMFFEAQEYVAQQNP